MVCIQRRDVDIGENAERSRAGTLERGACFPPRVRDGRKVEMTNSALDDVYREIDDTPHPGVDTAGYAPFGFVERETFLSSSRKNIRHAKDLAACDTKPGAALATRHAPLMLQ